MRNKKLKIEKKRHYTRMAVLHSLISPWKRKGEKRKKKFLQHGVFVFGHPFKYYPRPTGLNFVEPFVKTLLRNYCKTWRLLRNCKETQSWSSGPLRFSCLLPFCFAHPFSFFICVLLFCLRFAFLFAFCFLVCDFFFFNFRFFFFVCVFFFFNLRFLFLFAFSFFFCLRFLF